MNTKYAGTYCFQIMIKFQILSVLTNCTFPLGIPLTNLHTTLDLNFRTFPIYSYSQTDRSLSVFRKPPIKYPLSLYL